MVKKIGLFILIIFFLLALAGEFLLLKKQKEEIGFLKERLDSLKNSQKYMERRMKNLREVTDALKSSLISLKERTISLVEETKKLRAGLEKETDAKQKILRQLNEFSLNLRLLGDKISKFQNEIGLKKSKDVDLGKVSVEK